MGEYVTIEVADGSFQAFVERPDAANGPAVIVLHEVFGINDDMRASCRELAERGFIAVCPDLFWRQEPGLDLSHWTDAEWQKGLSLYQAYDRDQGARDIADIISYCRILDGASGKAGLMGYCLGGLMTFLVTARTGADASVAYYPGSTQDYVGEAPSVRSPMLVHLGEEDEFISKPAQRTIREALADNPFVEVHSYPGCSHAFARHTGAHYDAQAAALANGRTWDFLSAHLR